MILSRLRPQNRETVLGASVGEDCCAIHTGGDLCIVSTDPITASVKQAGRLAILINANDIASAGAVPIAALTTILLPSSAGKEEVLEVVEQLINTARELNVDITGGHTEVTDSVNKIVVSVTMMGKPVVPGKVFRTADMEAESDIVLTKYAGMEGTAIIAGDYASEIKELLDDEAKAQLELIQNSLSVVKEGITAAGIEGVMAMHDITEGGLLGAIAEMCEASGTGAIIDLSKVPVLGVTEKICAHYEIDVFGLISSGSMLISAGDGKAVVEGLAEKGIKATVIGKATRGGGIKDSRTGGTLLPYEVDELYKVIEKERRL